MGKEINAERTSVRAFFFPSAFALLFSRFFYLRVWNRLLTTLGCKCQEVCFACLDQFKFLILVYCDKQNFDILAVG